MDLSLAALLGSYIFDSPSRRRLTSSPHFATASSPPLHPLTPHSNLAKIIQRVTGDNVYNFGELLGHAVLKSLEGTEYAWLIEARRVVFTSSLRMQYAVLLSVSRFPAAS